MNDHQFGRRHYDDDHALLARIDERVGQLVLHAEKLNGRIGNAEARLDMLEGMHDREQGASDERKRMLSIVKAIKDIVPPASVAAAVALALHFMGGK